MKAAATQWSRIAGRLSVLLVLHILHNSVNAVRMAVLFPYIRTTISCTSTTSSVNDRSSEYWSGSLFCNDKDYVAKQAQAYYGYAMGINLIVQFIAISALGALADLFGRKPVMILAWTGIFIETLLNAVFGNFAAMISGRFFQGLFGAYSTVVSAAIADMSDLSNRGSFYSVHMTLGNFITAIATLLSSLLIVNQHLYDYQTVWTILSVLSAIGILISAVLFKETISLEKRDSWDLKKLCTNPSKSVILKYSYLSRLVFALFLLILSIMSVTILPGYVVELYSWKQEYVVYLQLGASLISTFAAGITFSLIPKYGSRFVLQLSYACGFLAIFLLLLSYFSPVIMIIANIFLGLSFMGTPAYYDELSKHVPQNEQGRVQSSFSAAFLVAAGIGAVIYGKIFQSLPLNAVYVPFLIAILIYVVSWAFVTYLFRSFAESTSELQARIQHVELEESMTSPEIAGYDLKNKNLI